MNTADFDFDLPRDLIAQEPLPERSGAKMMVVHRSNGRFEHRKVENLPEYLCVNDLLVVNDTRVIPARLFGRRKDSGGRVELMLVEKLEERCGSLPYNFVEIWDAFYRASRRPRSGLFVSFDDDNLVAEIISVQKEGRIVVRFSCDRPLPAVLEKRGFAPVPPYIHRSGQQASMTDVDKIRYQTVYASNPGAIAAPTAGLHFTGELLEELRLRGVGKVAVTLHVGPGTFKPVKVETVEDHIMEPERFVVSQETASAVNQVKGKSGRIIAVGSTTVRTLESMATEDGLLRQGAGRTSLFIFPGYSFRLVNVMMTNFHLPKSSLLMMVSAFAGRNLIMDAYREAISLRYRFYSYGDCMIII